MHWIIRLNTGRYCAIRKLHNICKGGNVGYGSPCPLDPVGGEDSVGGKQIRKRRMQLGLTVNLALLAQLANTALFPNLLRVDRPG